MQATAQAKTALDVGITEQLIRKPDSVLAMTCFDQAARVSAQRGGSVFSGDFWGAGLGNMVQDSMSSMLNNFAGSILQLNPSYTSLFSGTWASFGSLLSGSFSCNGMRDLWTDVLNQPINTQVPPLLMSNLSTYATTGVLPTGVTATSELGRNLISSLGVFTNMNTRITALPRAIIPNYSGSTNLSSVLRCSGAMTGPCP